jgi:hypothetical protein
LSSAASACLPATCRPPASRSWSSRRRPPRASGLQPIQSSSAGANSGRSNSPRAPSTAARPEPRPPTAIGCSTASRQGPRCAGWPGKRPPWRRCSSWLPARSPAAWICTCTARVRFHPEDACFLRITEAPLRAGGVQDLSWLLAALDLYRRHGTALNSHDCQYRTCLPGLELEHKYTLPPDADIWALAAQTHLRLSNGDLPGFAPKYRDETQAWDYVNHLFEVTEPEQERGYVAFIPTAGGRHLVKRKWFAIDAAARREQHIFGVDVDRGYDEHLRRVLGLRARPLPPFRRVRYDVNIESARTGHVFGVLYDRCHLLDASDEVLRQCEIEYTRTRTVLPTAEHDLLHDMETVATWLEACLGEHGPAPSRGWHSKLTFLREAVGRRPELRQ